MLSLMKRAGLAVLLTVLCACTSGSGDPVVPVEGSGGETLDPSVDYPEGPYGTQVGGTLRSFCFDGYVDPSAGLGTAMPGLELNDIPAPERLAQRGW